MDSVVADNHALLECLKWQKSNCFAFVSNATCTTNFVAIAFIFKLLLFNLMDMHSNL